MAKSSVSTKQMNELKTMVGQVNRSFNDLNKTLSEMSVQNIKKVTDETKKLKEEIESVGDAADEMGTGFGHLFKMLKSSPKNLNENAKSAGKWAERMKEMSVAGTAVGGSLGTASKMAGVLGKAVGGVSAAMRGWPGMVLMAVKTIVDGVVKIDSYIKNMNKRFAMVRGPSIMTQDVGKQFREFNMAIVNMAANIRDGLNSDQVFGFMESLSQTGKRVTTLNEGFFGYRDAVHVAAKASKVLGLEMTEVGGMMGQMMTDMRMNLDDVDDAFVQVAFDAEKSGLNTNKFWTAVNNATASLSFYGKFLTSVSTQMKALTETQLTGADQAANSIQEVTGIFAKQTIAQNLAFVELARNSKGGSKIFSKAYEQLSKKFKDEAEKLGGQELHLEQKYAETKDPATLRELEKVRKQIQNAQNDASDAAKAAKGDSHAQAVLLPKLADKSAGFLFDIMEGINQGPLSKLDPVKNADQFHALIQAMKSIVPGASEETVRTWIEMARRGADTLNEVLGVSTTGTNIQNNMAQFLEDLNKGDTSAQVTADGIMDILGKINENMTPEEATAAATALAKLLETDEGMAKSLIQGAKISTGFKTGLEKLISKADAQELTQGTMAGSLSALVSSSDLGTEIAKDNFNTSGDMFTAAEAQKNAYDQTFEQIRDSTLSLDDMKKIAEDDLKYKAVSLLNLDVIAKATSEMVNKKVADYMPALSKAQIESSRAITKLSSDEGLRTRKRQNMGMDPVMMTAINTMSERRMGATYKRISSISTGLGSIEGPADAAKMLTDYKTGDKKNAPEAEEMIRILSSIMKTDKGVATLDYKKLSEEQRMYKTEAERARMALLAAQETTKSTKGTMDNTAYNNKMVEALVMGSAESKDFLWEQVKLLSKEKGATLLSNEDLKEMFGPMANLVGQLIVSKGGRTTDIGYSVAGLDGFGNSPGTGETKKKKLGGKATLQVPEVVTSPGAVILHPQETIIPADYALKTSSIMTESAGAMAGGAGGGGMPPIIINASDYVMAGKLKKAIENTVREVIYQDQVTN